MCLFSCSGVVQMWTELIKCRLFISPPTTLNVTALNEDLSEGNWKQNIDTHDPLVLIPALIFFFYFKNKLTQGLSF